MGRVSSLSLLHLIAPPASAQGERRLPLVDAALSSDLGPDWARAEMAIDNNEATACGSQIQQASNRPWLTARLQDTDEIIRYVDILNSADQGSRDWLSPYEVWLGTSPHDFASPTSARCVDEDTGLPSIVYPPDGPTTHGGYKRAVCSREVAAGKTYITLRLSSDTCAW